MQILLVEDSDADALALTRSLELAAREKPCFHRARRLSKALEAIRRDSFDIVLLDLHLPDSAGAETVETFMDALPEGGPAVVVITSHEDDASAIAALKRGAEDYLVKGDLGPRPVYRVLRHAVERHRMAQELDRTTQRARAAERLASIATLAAGLAHEIGTPMNMIRGHAARLANATFEPRLAEDLRFIEKQVNRVTQVLSALLQMARPSGARERIAADVELTVRDTFRLVSDRAKRRGVETRVRIDSPLWIDVQPGALEKVLLNLVTNALDSMPGGGLLEVVAEASEGQVELRVGDTGSGIPEEALARIFEPFFTSKGRGYGSGLGLAVVEGIVAEHGGTISIPSTGPGGTVFRVVFPAAGPGPADEGPA